MSTIHSSCCTYATQVYLEKVALFQKEHPNHCPTCKGWGMHVMLCYDAPTGEVMDTCSHCIDENLCPLCMKETTEGEDGYDLCTECVWSAGNEMHIGMHEEPDCLCWAEEIGI